MSQLERKWFGACICFFMVSTVWGQGCSDAGFCTLHPIKPTNQLDSSGQFQNKIAIGFNRGLGDFGIFVSTGYVDYTRFVGKKWSLNAKLTGLVANGELANTVGFSDIYVNANYAFTPKLKGTLGLKLPLNSGNLHQDGLPLPMNYQTSLGTYDLIAGLSYYFFQRLGLTVAIQQPIVQNNNQFNPTAYPETSPARHYVNTFQYERKGDVLFRLNYRWTLIKNKLELTPGILPIYHLGEDTYEYGKDQRNPIEGSEGLTLNANLFLLYSFHPRHAVELNYGTPFITRKIRPDGLTREYVFGIEYRTSF